VSFPDPTHLITLALSVEGLLVFVGILVISAISNWIKRRGQPQEPGGPSFDETTPPPRRAAPRQPKRLGDWEEELRRLLGEEPSAPPQAPPQPPPPPPVVRPPPIARPPPLFPVPARPVLTPPRRAEVEQESTWSPEEEEVVVNLPQLREADRAYQDASNLHEKVSKRMQHVAHELGDLSRASAAYGRAQSLHTTVSGQMEREISSSFDAPEFVARSRLTKTRASAYARLFRNQESIRSAFVGGLILGPPKSMED